jgi:hypothetical protein
MGEGRGVQEGEVTEMLPQRHNRELFVSLVLATTHQRQVRGEVDSRSGCITFYFGGVRPPQPPLPIGGPRKGLGRAELKAMTPRPSQ